MAVSSEDSVGVGTILEFTEGLDSVLGGGETFSKSPLSSIYDWISECWARV